MNKQKILHMRDHVHNYNKADNMPVYNHYDCERILLINLSNNTLLPLGRQMYLYELYNSIQFLFFLPSSLRFQDQICQISSLIEAIITSIYITVRNGLCMFTCKKKNPLATDLA